MSLELFVRVFIHALLSRVTLASAGLSCFVLYPFTRCQHQQMIGEADWWR